MEEWIKSKICSKCNGRSSGRCCLCDNTGRERISCRARIRHDLMDAIDNYFDGTEGHKSDPDFQKLCDRIAGAEVDLRFIGPDAFEAIDNRYWLPDSMWAPLPPLPAEDGDTLDESGEE